MRPWLSTEVNVCAGPFGAFYDYWIKRPRLARVVGATIWGIDVRPLYTSIAGLLGLARDAVVLDIACGGGVAFRGLAGAGARRVIAADLSSEMLRRAMREADRVGLTGVEFLRADMRALPVRDDEADVTLLYSGLHMIPDPGHALAEAGRCTKSGGRLFGSTFSAGGARRQAALLHAAERNGMVGTLPSEALIDRWLHESGFSECRLSGAAGFAVFEATRT